MHASRPRRPTDAELAILRVLWDRGPSTVREVYEVLAQGRETGYTTTLKLMQIMADKGLVTRNMSSRTHIYSARASQARTQGQLIDDLLERAFGGSAVALVQRALSTHRASDEELQEIFKLIEAYQKERR